MCKETREQQGGQKLVHGQQRLQQDEVLTHAQLEPKIVTVAELATVADAYSCSTRATDYDNRRACNSEDTYPCPTQQKKFTLQSLHHQYIHTHAQPEPKTLTAASAKSSLKARNDPKLDFIAEPSGAAKTSLRHHHTRPAISRGCQGNTLICTPCSFENSQLSAGSSTP